MTIYGCSSQLQPLGKRVYRLSFGDIWTTTCSFGVSFQLITEDYKSAEGSHWNKDVYDDNHDDNDEDDRGVDDIEVVRANHG